MNKFLADNKFANELAKRIEGHTRTRFFDWIDHMAFSENKFDIQDIILLNYRENKDLELPPETRLYHIPESTLFPLLIHSKDTTELTIGPENIRAFQKIWSVKSGIKGKENAPYNTLEVSKQNNKVLMVCERRGYNGFVTKEPDDLEAYLEALDFFRIRKRDAEEDLTLLEEQILSMSANLKNGRMADAFFRAEREYWEARNFAGRHQKKLQDDVGLGWGNRDHQAFRCSRKNFSRIVRIFESLGMQPRERFYAGKQAGWGAQVLEHPTCKEAVFADVDLNPEESGGDFAHEDLTPKKELGTVGLWVGLHGESILSAGIHHLAALVNFQICNTELPEQGVPVMAPFSSLPFLKQAFTRGDTWRPEKKRLDVLRNAGSIDDKQEEKFLSLGAIGGHLEIIERNSGFKGFNQDSVSAIIKATDPRVQHEKGA
ncbi:MAG: hypothetical protein JSV09_01450 [Thermoplasmata archaeon]|nr:MAG: hypothetical protein JSV09_01450 [Thermoplasmata archaeon]